MSEPAVPDAPEGVVFAVEDALFDEVPYRPWLSPLGVTPDGVDPGDRRVIGRAERAVLVVTDLPPHFVHRSEPPGYPRTHQYFDVAADLVDWVHHAAAGTRFRGAAEFWNERARFVAAAEAVRAGLDWDADGNIVILPVPDARARGPVRRLRLHPAVEPARSHPEWQILDPDAADPSRPLADAELAAVLASPVYDVCVDGLPFDFAIHTPATSFGSFESSLS